MNSIDMIMGIFDKSNVRDRYFRIPADFRNDIYLGRNKDDKMTLVVTGEPCGRKAVSTLKIQARYFVRSDGKGALEISLLDERFVKVFIRFCDDVVLNSVDVDKNDILDYAFTRWGLWREMFKETGKMLLSEERIKGLMGELLFLKNDLFPDGESKAVESWIGCLRNEKDFVTGTGWYEIKSIGTKRHTVSISSIEQLESGSEGLEGFLVVCRFTKTNRENPLGMSLNDLVLDIMGDISGPRVKERFNTKLASAGYGYDPDYDEIRYEYVITEYYRVDEDFPRLRRNEIRKEIISAQYEISIAGLNEWRKKTWI